MPLSEHTKSNPRYAQLRLKKIPGLAEWMSASKSSRISLFDRRNSKEILAIDNAVLEYEKIASRPNVPLAQESEALITLFEAIEVYLATPRGHAGRRLAAVSDLRQITLFTLSDIRWKKYKEVTGGHRPGMKPMIQHVWSEMHSPGHARVGHGMDNVPDPWLRGEVKDEKYLFQYLSKVRRDHDSQIDGVRYIEDEDRWNYQVVFRDDGYACERFVKQKGVIVKGILKPIHTSGGDLGTGLYAIDENGVLYHEMSTQSLNHCSFLAGRPVKCAGMIGINQGIVGYIDNGSGHYRPSRRNLVNGLEALKSLVGPLIFPWIIVRDHSGRYPKAAYEADKFLNTRGNCLPVGYYKNFNSRFDGESLVRFSNPAEARDFFANQESGIEREKIQNKLNEVMSKYELYGKKGKLESDEEREIFKAALQYDLIPQTSVEIYFKDDPPMQQWLRRNYGVRIPVT